MPDRLVLPDVSAAAWESFQVGRPTELDADLAACWSRAVSLGAPADGARPEEQLVRGELLRLHASHVEVINALGASILDRATARLSDRDFMLLLADGDGVVVHTRGGGSFADTANRVRLIEGACWSEAARGTNAIGTAATENVPTEVHGHAHFGRSYHDLVCYAAPIRGPNGRPLAIIDATSLMACADPFIGRTIADTAYALEGVLRLQAYASAGMSVTRTLSRSLDRMREPAFLVEAPGTIARANAAARELIGPRLAGTSTALFDLEWASLVTEALAPTTGGMPIVLRDRAWRMRLEPIIAPTGDVMSVVALLEPGRMLARPRRAHVEIVEPFSPIFAEDAAVTAAIEWSRRLAASELPIMLLAETGSGKELFAQAIHMASPRAGGPWHAINCGALSPSLLESELFGYAPNAFTGADRAGRAGAFHAASGGTLFLDEVAEMSPAMQAALLRVVETGTYRRVGETRLERTDVRIICATCRSLPELVAAGTFRQDLYYRLKGATVRIPSLRERTDLIALARHLLDHAVDIAPDAEAALARHRWPGNVRELKSTLAVARVASAGDTITLDDLPPELLAVELPAATLDDSGRETLVRALAETRNNTSAAARKLGVARSTVQRMRRKYGV